MAGGGWREVPSADALEAGGIINGKRASAGGGGGDCSRRCGPYVLTPILLVVVQVRCRATNLGVAGGLLHPLTRNPLPPPPPPPVLLAADHVRHRGIGARVG